MKKKLPAPSATFPLPCKQLPAATRITALSAAAPLYPAQTTTLSAQTRKDVQTPASTMSISFLAEHVPASENIQFVIGPSQALHSIGKGGMGEVFLAYDTTCGRRLAFRKDPSRSVAHQRCTTVSSRKLGITAGSTHPAIIPIMPSIAKPI